jgi:hypothetical protein
MTAKGGRAVECAWPHRGMCDAYAARLRPEPCEVVCAIAPLEPDEAAQPSESEREGAGPHRYRGGVNGCIVCGGGLGEPEHWLGEPGRSPQSSVEAPPSPPSTGSREQREPIPCRYGYEPSSCQVHGGGIRSTACDLWLASGLTASEIEELEEWLVDANPVFRGQVLAVARRALEFKP